MSLATEFQTRPLGGFRILNCRSAELIGLLGARMAAGAKTALVFANTNFVVQCQDLRAAMQAPDVLIANDGIGLDLASLALYQTPFVDNLNGTDLTPALLRSFKRPTRVYLYGATPESVAGAVKTISTLPNIVVAGYADGYGKRIAPANVIADINRCQPEVLLIALGNPRQERWIVENREQLDVPLIIGVGALFDFLSGSKLRAPALVQKLHLEWAFRLLQEPRRLLKRYTYDIGVFFALCMRIGKRV